VYPESEMAFNERKVADMAAFFLHSSGGRLPVLKLMKLLYLADRAAMDSFNFPISGDRMVSMPNGPVLSRTLDLMNGYQVQGQGQAWNSKVADREEYEVSIKPDSYSAEGNLITDSLSEAEKDILQATYKRFGGMGKYQLVDYTHDKCAEWKDPNGSSSPIGYEDVFIALGRNKETAAEAAEDIESCDAVDRIFASL
jgi:uncharacterized phage-associated protein